MSPEQLRGKELDGRTDLYSFGVVLYETATGLLPFRGETSAVITEAILNRTPTAATKIIPSLPVKLEETINKALEKDRDMRCQTAGEMRADLKRVQRSVDTSRTSVVSETTGSSSSVTTVTRTTTTSQKSRPIAMILGVCVAVALAAGIFAGKLLFSTGPNSAAGLSSAYFSSRQHSLCAIRSRWADDSL